MHRSCYPSVFEAAFERFSEFYPFLPLNVSSSPVDFADYVLDEVEDMENWLGTERGNYATRDKSLVSRLVLLNLELLPCRFNLFSGDVACLEVEWKNTVRWIKLFLRVFSIFIKLLAGRN